MTNPLAKHWRWIGLSLASLTTALAMHGVEADSWVFDSNGHTRIEHVGDAIMGVAALALAEALRTKRQTRRSRRRAPRRKRKPTLGSDTCGG